MTVQRFTGVGYCARISAVGDWAFDFALRVAREHNVRLNIFFFPLPPCGEHPSRGRHGERGGLTESEKIDLERVVRLYYDERLGDFLNAGFRLCEGDEEPELLRCLLVRKDYDVLVLAYEYEGCHFGQRPIEEFAQRMSCPTVLVGPDRSDQIYLNRPAAMWSDTLGLTAVPWQELP